MSKYNKAKTCKFPMTENCDGETGVRQGSDEWVAGKTTSLWLTKSLLLLNTTMSLSGGEWIRANE
jgi:hypothetical protein